MFDLVCVRLFDKVKWNKGYINKFRKFFNSLCNFIGWFCFIYKDS